MAKGHFRPRKTECHYCGAQDKELRRFSHNIFLCLSCAWRNGYIWEKGIQDKAPYPRPSTAKVVVGG